MLSKIVPCADCGKEFPRKKLNRHLRCPDCAMEKMFNVIRQQGNKSGPEYEHWKKSMKEKGLARLKAFLEEDDQTQLAPVVKI